MIRITIKDRKELMHFLIYMAKNNYKIIINNADGNAVYIFLEDKKVELSHITNDNYIMPIDDKNKIGWLYSIFNGGMTIVVPTNDIKKHDGESTQSTPTRSKHRYEGKTKDGGYGVCEDCGCRENTKEETESCIGGKE